MIKSSCNISRSFRRCTTLTSAYVLQALLALISYAFPTQVEQLFAFQLDKSFVQGGYNPNPNPMPKLNINSDLDLYPTLVTRACVYV
jgi:hypothetical protein